MSGSVRKLTDDGRAVGLPLRPAAPTHGSASTGYRRPCIAGNSARVSATVAKQCAACVCSVAFRSASDFRLRDEHLAALLAKIAHYSAFVLQDSVAQPLPVRFSLASRRALRTAPQYVEYSVTRMETLLRSIARLVFNHRHRLLSHT